MTDNERQASVSEDVITDEMIEAGVREILDFDSDELVDCAELVAKNVFVAMRAAETKEVFRPYNKKEN